MWKDHYNWINYAKPFSGFVRFISSMQLLTKKVAVNKNAHKRRKEYPSDYF